MNDKGLSVLDKYEFNLKKTGREKGAVLLDTDKGFFLLKEYNGSPQKLQFENDLLKSLWEKYGIKGDYTLENSNGELISDGEDGKSYIVKRWFKSRDMEQKNPKHIKSAGNMLGRLHKGLRNIGDLEVCTENRISDMEQYFGQEFLRHNNEMRRTRNFIRQKKRKNEFELMVLDSFDRFWEEGKKAEEEFYALNMNEFIKKNCQKKALIHGAYNYHNLVFVGEEIIVTNYSKVKYGIQVRDLYDFMRKTLEKMGWDTKIGKSIIEEYQKNNVLSQEEKNYLLLKLCYPEKYWKILSHYNNTGKVWIPDKDVIKLKNTIAEAENRKKFINSLLI